MQDALKKIRYQCDFCVIGGGLSGSFAALAAARMGAKVIVMQDRPMLGGNASSEIRMWVRGAKGKYNREGGMLNELEERNIARNPTLVPSLFDATLYDLLRENENIQLLMNTSCLDAKMDGNKIVSVTGWQMTTYTYITVEADYFADCSGDSILAPLTGAEYRKGRESKAAYGETLGQEKEDACTMGMSILLAARETDHPVKFTPPAFANCYPTDESFSNELGKTVHAQPRSHHIGTSRDNLWWVELGGEGDSLHDADKIRDELLRCIYGVWDHIKNQEDHGMENWDLEWVGFLPGKRETRRYVGDYVVTEHDILAGGHFEDEVAYGGWPLDDHNPYGMRQTGESNVPSIMIPVEEPYGLPLRALYSRNVENLFFAGRNISVTHAALSSTRVMGTCSVLGQAMGTAAGTAVKYHCSPRRVWEEHTKEVQKILLDAGAFLPHIKRDIHPLMLEASMNVEEQVRLSLLNGWDRPRQEGEEKGLLQTPGDALELSWDAPREIPVLRLKFDPDYSRFSVSDNAKMRVFAQKLHTGFDFAPVRPAGTVAKGFVVYADGEEIFRTEKNEQSFVKIPLHVQAQKLRILWTASYGKKVGLHSVDFLDE